MAIESSFKQEMGGTEKAKKAKKVRSIKPPKGSKTKQEETRFEWPSPDLSSNSSSSKKASSQDESESEDSSVSSSSSGSTVSIKSSDLRGVDLKKTLKKSRSRKHATLVSFRSSRRRAKSRFDQTSVISQENAAVIQQQYPSSMEVSDASPGHHSQASSRHSETSFRSSDNNKGSSHYNRMQKLSRTSSLRTARIFKKNKMSFKPKRSSIENYSEVSQDPSLERATCSSTLKDSKFPKQLELHPGKDESEKIAVMKVCPYQHCSLHGNHHHDAPDQDPPKRFEYLKRRSAKTQGTGTQLTTPVKRSGKRREEVKSRQTVLNEESTTTEEANGRNAMATVGNKEDFSIEFYAKSRSEPLIGARRESEDADLADILFGVNSFQDNLNDKRNEEVDILKTPAELNETRCSTCCAAIKLDKTISQSANIDLKERSIVEEDKNGLTKFTVELREDEPSIVRVNDIDIAAEEKTDTSSASNVCPFEETSVITEEKSVDFDAYAEFVSESTQGDSLAKGPSKVKDSEVSASGSEANKSQTKKESRLSMWYMIHRQMVSGLAAEAGSKPLEQADKVKEVHLADAYSDSTVPERKDFSSQTSFSESDTGTETQDSVSRDIEIRKMFAIKLVREAIEKILLPEVQDDQSVTSDVNSEQDLAEKCYGEGGGELSLLTPTDSANHSSTENDNNKVANISGQEERVAIKTGKKSESKAPKRWSYLKKVILLNRFCKELEKVKKFNPKKPKYLPLELETKSETVSLRRQMVGDKKNSEEWMLDFALRQVVSELAPTQKRKVALLVKAFETVVPSDEDQHIKVTVPKHRNSTPKGASQQLPIELKQEVHNCEFSSSNTELCKGGSELKGVPFETNADAQISNSTRGPSEPIKVTTAKEEKPRESKLEGIFSQNFPSPAGSKLGSTAKGAQETVMDKQKQIKMWHMIYQHVATDIATKVGSRLLLDGSDEEVDDATKSLASDTTPDYSTTKSGVSTENHDASHDRLEFSRSDAVKLVQEAVDEILLPEVQDDASDTQSVASEMSPDLEFLSKEEGVEFGKEETPSAVDHICKAEEDRPTSGLKNKLDPQKSKNWSKLKKLILLKRSIKALQQVKKVNPKPPQKLPLTGDTEGEKVDLRRHMMEERKKAEQWMLDYAVRHIVTTLTPARKRRVAMLVEAFEAVVPLPEN